MSLVLSSVSLGSRAYITILQYCVKKVHGACLTAVFIFIFAPHCYFCCNCFNWTC